MAYNQEAKTTQKPLTITEKSKKTTNVMHKLNTTELKPVSGTCSLRLMAMKV